MKENLKRFLKYVMPYILIPVIVVALIVPTMMNKRDDDIPYVLDIYRHNIELKYFGAKDALSDSLDTYMREIAPSTCMNAISFIDISESYGIDVFFMIAQCQNESSFSTAGLSLKTNSAFGVKAYDGKGAKHMDKYEHPDLSIEPYVQLLVSDYIGDGITEYDLLQKYVNKEGKRYAKDANYESKLYRIYTTLENRFGDTYREFIKLKTLSGK